MFCTIVPHHFNHSIASECQGKVTHIGSGERIELNGIPAQCTTIDPITNAIIASIVIERLSNSSPKDVLVLEKKKPISTKCRQNLSSVVVKPRPEGGLRRDQRAVSVNTAGLCLSGKLIEKFPF